MTSTSLLRSLGITAMVGLPLTLCFAFYAISRTYATGQEPAAAVVVAPLLATAHALQALLPPSWFALAWAAGALVQMLACFIVVHAVRMLLAARAGAQADASSR